MTHGLLSPSHSPSPPYPLRTWGMRSLPLLDPLFCVFGLRVAHVKRNHLNAFFGHSRLFAHPKPHIQNDRRGEICNPVPPNFLLENTCYGFREPILRFLGKYCISTRVIIEVLVTRKYKLDCPKQEKEVKTEK